MLAFTLIATKGQATLSVRSDPPLCGDGTLGCSHQIIIATRDLRMLPSIGNNTVPSSIIGSGRTLFVRVTIFAVLGFFRANNHRQATIVRDNVHVVQALVPAAVIYVKNV